MIIYFVLEESASAFFGSALMSNPSDPKTLYMQGSLVLEQVVSCKEALFFSFDLFANRKDTNWEESQ